MLKGHSGLNIVEALGLFRCTVWCVGEGKKKKLHTTLAITQTWREKIQALVCDEQVQRVVDNTVASNEACDLGGGGKYHALSARPSPCLTHLVQFLLVTGQNLQVHHQHVVDTKHNVGRGHCTEEGEGGCRSVKI